MIGLEVVVCHPAAIAWETVPPRASTCATEKLLCRSTGNIIYYIILALALLISLMLRTNYVIRVMRIKDKGDKALNQIAINR